MTHTMTNSINKDKVALLLAEYLKDPNCWPELWISGEDVNHAEKQLFIELALDQRDFDRFLGNCEKLHP